MVDSVLRDSRGFTVIDLIVTMLMLAVVATIVLPRAIRRSPQLEVDLAARALARDIEQLRMRAISAKRSIRVKFYEGEGFYTAFMDITPGRQAVFAETAEEVQATDLLVRDSYGGLPGVALPKTVEFGAGIALRGPQGHSVEEAVALDGDMIELDARGLVKPPGSGGIVYLVHREDPQGVAAVTISGASAVRAWRYRTGRWIE